MYLGFVALNGSIPLAAQTKDGTGAPKNADALPTFRVYGPNGLMTGGTGSLGLKDTGAITGATNASPIVVTSANHGLTSGTRVTIAGVVGNTGANGTFTVAVIDANTFSLVGSTGTGGYTSGGAWNVAGLYGANFSVLAASGYLQGQTYTVLVSSAVGGTAGADLDTFTVV